MDEEPPPVAQPPAISRRFGLLSISCGLISLALSSQRIGLTVALAGIVLGILQLLRKRPSYRAALAGIALCGMSTAAVMLPIPQFAVVFLDMAIDLENMTEFISPSPDPTLKEIQKPLLPEKIWSFPLHEAAAICVGDWNHDGHDDVLVADTSPALTVFDAAGARIASIPLPEAFMFIELGSNGAAGPQLLGYTNDRHVVTVVDQKGSIAWKYPCLHACDGAHWGDLDGDGVDEMIVGMNGNGGLHAVNSNGKSIWQVRSVGNVWSQAIIPVCGDKKSEIIVTDVSGKITTFNAAGWRTGMFAPKARYYAKMIAGMLDKGKIAQVVAIGASLGSDASFVTAFDDEGHVAWSVPAGEDAENPRADNIACGDADGDGIKDWAFPDDKGNILIVSHDGVELGIWEVNEDLVGCAILPRQGEASLLIAVGQSDITAYSLNRHSEPLRNSLVEQKRV